MTSSPDARPALSAALDQTSVLIAGTTPDQYSLPTPCTEFDVRRLIGHLLGVVGRIGHVGAGGAPFDVPSIIEDYDDPMVIWEAKRAELDKIWSDDAVVERMVQVPWGDAPGGAVAAGYAQELLTHGWDLAVATGRRSTLDDALPVPSLAFARERVPATPRGDRIPFGPVVEAGAELGTYEQLAAWLGRDPSPWL